MVLPTSVEVNLKTFPHANLALIGVCSLVMLVFGVPEWMLLTRLDPVELVAHLFIHAGFLHLLGNMLYLWVFGNAVLDKIGNVWFLAVFLLTGVVGGVAQVMVGGVPALGASGAVNGIIGFYLVVYPTNRVHCVYWFFIRAGEFSLPGFVLILIWFFMDNVGAVSGSDGVGYLSHIGGFLSGFGLGWIFLACGWARMAHYDNDTLLEIWGLPIGKRLEKPQPVVAGMPNIDAEGGGLEDAGAPLEMTCPYCEEDLEALPEFVGTIFECPVCGEEISVSID